LAKPPQTYTTPEPPYRLIFVVLSLVSLAFMFGTPLYALVYYGLPGLNQSHTPFRWVYALTLSVAVLTAFGWDCLTSLSSHRVKRVFSWALLALGAAILLGLGASYALYEPVTEGVVTTALTTLARANEAFPDPRAFYSHLFVQFATFGAMTLLSGVVFWIVTYTVHRQRRRNRFEEKRDFHGGRRGLWAFLRPGWADFAMMSAIMLVAMDLMFAYADFNPRSDPALLDFTPPVIEWMTGQPGEWRYTTLDDPSQPPILQPNMTWRYGLDDVRGYESIIPKPYVDYMRDLYPQVQLDFNRIAPLYTTYDHVGLDFDPRTALTDARFHALNIRHVVTHLTTDISDVDGYLLVYEDEAVRVWENANAYARAYIPDEDARLSAEVLNDTSREMMIRLPDALPANPTLIVSMAHFPGWRAYLQSPDGTEVRLDVTTQSIFPQVALPDDADGATVRFVYSPQSFQVGAFGSALGGIVSLFLLGVWAWRRFVVANDADGRALLARNSIAPVVLNLFNRAIDFVLAFVVLRVLGPEDTGIYYYAVVVFVWFDIFTNFGLDVYLMREVGRDRDRAADLFMNTTVFRLLLSLIGVFLLLGFLFARQNAVADPFETRGIIALLLLYVGLVPGSLNKGMTSLYYAYERAEYPAAVSTVTTITRAVLTVIVLTLGYGIIGIAGVSIFNNFVTLAILFIAGRDMLANLRAARPRPKLLRGMANESYPLMLNHFLATIFFQIDVVILEALRGAAIVGKYSVGYRWLLALNVIPAFFTMALFPRLSRQATEDRAAMRRGYTLSLKLLAALVFPAAVLLTFLAYPLTLLLGGSAFLPEGAIALQIMVWSMPLGWMNSLTQYVLIALDRQRQLTWAFAAAVTFNIVTNLIFIPVYGYRAAAVTTIFSELALMIGFTVLLRTEMHGVNVAALMWRPALAAGLMSAAMLVGAGVHLALAVVVGVIVYPVALLVLRPLTPEEWATLAPVLPSPIRSRLVPEPA
jgi:O-antigen/teichoic acid export membrane protein